MAFHFVDPEDGFTSAVIKDSKRFVGRQNLIGDCLSALNTVLSQIWRADPPDARLPATVSGASM
jgi:hypothetical protein